MQSPVLVAIFVLLFSVLPLYGYVVDGPSGSGGSLITALIPLALLAAGVFSGVFRQNIPAEDVTLTNRNGAKGDNVIYAGVRTDAYASS